MVGADSADSASLTGVGGLGGALAGIDVARLQAVSGVAKVVMRARELGPPGATSKGCGKQRGKRVSGGEGERCPYFQMLSRLKGLRENGDLRKRDGRGNLTPGYYLRWRASSPGCAVGEQRPSFDATVAVLSGLRRGGWGVGLDGCVAALAFRHKGAQRLPLDWLAARARGRATAQQCWWKRRAVCAKGRAASFPLRGTGTWACLLLGGRC